jgi:chromate transporter
VGDGLSAAGAGQTSWGQGIPLRQAFWTWLKIASLSFGGPTGQIAVMHRILVDEKRWVSEARFLHALNFCMLLPGPEAQQLATYIGWLMHRTAGGIVAGGLFILPGIVSIMALSWIYVAFGNIGLVGGLLFGLKAAVVAVVLHAVVRISRRALANRVMVAIAAAAFAAIFFLDAPFPAIIAAAAALGYASGRAGLRSFRAGEGRGAGRADRTLLSATFVEPAQPRLAVAAKTALPWLVLWLVPVGALVVLMGEENVFAEIAMFFSKMAIVTFGGAYAVLAYVAQEAVESFGWLKPGEMLDGLGMAETTPGPLIMVLQFVGFMAAFREPGSLPPMLAGTLGGLLATWVTFTPCFLWIFLGAPFIELMRGNRALAGALSAITAAVVGVILNLAIWFATHTLFGTIQTVRGPGFAFEMPVLVSVNGWATLVSAAAILAMFRFGIGMIPALAACSAAGVVLYGAGAI